MLGTKVSQWPATTSKDALHERAWPDLCLVRGSSVGRLKIGVICFNSGRYYAAEQEGLHRSRPNFTATSPGFQKKKPTSSPNGACRQGPTVAKGEQEVCAVQFIFQLWREITVPFSLWDNVG